MNKFTKSQVIIFEGMERCGKDTQIELMKSAHPEFAFRVMHFSNVKGLDADETREYSKKLYRRTFSLMDFCIAVHDQHLILNRAHLGETVYGKIYRGYEGNYVYDIEKQFKRVVDNVSLIVLVDEPENVMSREDGESLSEGKIDQISQEKERFELAYKKSIINHKTLININNKDIDTVKLEIESFVSGERKEIKHTPHIM